MSANQETMRSSIKAADVVKTVAVANAEATRQGTLAAASVLTGYRPGFPSGASTFDAAVKSANTQKVADLFAAESARQAAVFLAKDLLRSQGEIPF
ncbi:MULTISPECIES: hypothetical protein [Bradyrhizobium]|uniref:hypothetical protein n=1 Tax=Bradyrhizobium TaxID=374 RepID=UPI001EDAFAC9|nr:hypothetical protein [Bradyrhizobium zhengyangense]MCG2639664.1 hypothetical protein [Bradyrhizobium zhengyangense]